MVRTIFYFITALFCSDASRILAVFPMPSVSHQVVFRSLTQELVKLGHEVVVITTHPAFPKGAVKNLTEIDISELSLKEWNKRYISKTIGKENFLNNGLNMTLTAVTKTLMQQLDLEEIQDLMKQKFDLLILEAWIRPAMLWSHIIKAPVLKISSFGAGYEIYDIMGAPTQPFLFPMILQQRIFDLTIWDKLRELYNLYSIHKLHERLKKTENELIKAKLGDDFTTIDDLNENVDMFLVNIHPIWEGNRPVPLSVAHLGGLHLRPAKELPQDLKSHLDSSKNGVIYMSFGNNLYPSMVSPELVKMFIKVLSELPYDVLWKWGESIPGISKNIRVDKWFPQFDMLKHPKVKLFITQAGQQSTDEAIEAGIPLVGIPLVADQWFNADKYVEHGIGVKLDMETITEEEFRNAIYTVLGNESYYSNILRLRSFMRDSPAPALHRATWWSSHLLRHGTASHMRPIVTSLAQYLELELLAIVAVCLFTMLFILYTTMCYIIKIIFKVLCNKKKSKQC